MTGLRTDARPITSEPLELGEGPLWWSDSLHLVDILSGRLLRVGQGGRLEVVAELDVPLGAAIPIPDGSGRWVVAAGTGLAVVSPPDGIEWIGRPEEGRTVATRMNDAIADPSGRVWAGSMAWDARPGAGTLYRLDPDGRIAAVLGGITIPNGPVFSPDGTVMYLADSAAGQILRIRVDATEGRLGDRRPFVELEGGLSPDGMELDSAGGLWVAVWGSGGVRRYLPDGRLDTVVELPASQPSSVCLGGPDLRRLHITTARYGLDRPGEGDGLVYAVEVEVPGLPVRPAPIRWAPRRRPSPDGVHDATSGHGR